MASVRHEIFKLKGLVSDIDPAELMNGAPPFKGLASNNVWTGGKNITFDDGATHRIKGYAKFGDINLPAGAMPVYSFNVITPDTSYWIWVDSQGPDSIVYVTEGNQHWDISSNAALNDDTDFQDLTQWEVSLGLLIRQGGVDFTNADAGQLVRNKDFIPASDTYTITVNVSGYVSGELEVRLGGGTSPDKISSNGSHTVTIITSDTSLLEIAATVGNTTLTVDYVKIALAGVVRSHATGKWTSTILNGVPVLNNGIEPPVWWNGEVTDPMTELPDWPANTSCGSIRAFKFHLIAMDITVNSVRAQNKVMWSDGADAGTIPAEWAPSPSNDAGDALIGDTTGRVVDGAKLRDVFIIYKQHSCYTCQYVAGQFVFSFRSLFGTVGVQGVNCIVELQGHHWIFADDDIIRHNGNNYTSIIDNKIRSLIFKVIDIQKNYLCCVAINLPKDEIWFCLPEVDKTYNTKALIYSYEDAEWGIRDLPEIVSVNSGIMPFILPELTWDARPNTWDADTHLWNEATYSETDNGLVMTAPLNGQMYEVDASYSNDGEPVEAFTERLSWVLGGEAGSWTNVLTRALYPHITGEPGDIVKVHIGASMVPDGPVSWQTIEDYVIPADSFGQIKIDCMAYGRYLNMRFSSSGGSPWQLHRIGAEYVEEAIF